MSGSRTTTGCWTCRLRRKKCDEDTPACSSCVSRGLQCYGYGGKPAWMLDKQNWQQILDSDEAKSIRNAAEGAYRRRRQKHVDTVPGMLVQHLNEPSSALLDLDRTWSNCTQPLRDCDYAPNYQDIHTFLDVIFPLQWGFYRQPSRRWLFDTIVASEPMYHASRGLCITFETGVKAGFTNGRCEVTPEVRSSRLMALRGLQRCIAEMQQNSFDSSSLPKAVHSVAVILQLASLEIYGETEGLWEAHMNGAGTVLDLVETQIAGGIGQLLASPIETPALDFFVATYVWTDILAEAAHGISYSKPRAFNYLPLLQRDLIDTQCIMGCRNSVMTTIKEVSIFAASMSNGQHASPNERLTALTLRIQDLIQEEATRFSPSATDPEGDSNWVTLLHAHAALVYLQTVAAHQGLPSPPDMQQTVVKCLDLLEALPSRLFIRVCWPFTVAGCTASEGHHPRFRAVLRRVEEDRHVLGFTWKGLIIMEECWRLRRCKPESTWCWRTTMEHMQARILLV